MKYFLNFGLKLHYDSRGDYFMNRVIELENLQWVCSHETGFFG